jgi:hypothetical protein
MMVLHCKYKVLYIEVSDDNIVYSVNVHIVYCNSVFQNKYHNEKIFKDISWKVCIYLY